jgi:hypothetical protein
MAFFKLRQLFLLMRLFYYHGPPSDVITILHSLSIIRLATAEAENPAKLHE